MGYPKELNLSKDMESAISSIVSCSQMEKAEILCIKNIGENDNHMHVWLMIAWMSFKEEKYLKLGYCLAMSGIINNIDNTLLHIALMSTYVDGKEESIAMQEIAEGRMEAIGGIEELNLSDECKNYIKQKMNTSEFNG